jgi:hypothetical protein
MLARSREPIQPFLVIRVIQSEILDVAAMITDEQQRSGFTPHALRIEYLFGNISELFINGVRETVTSWRRRPSNLPVGESRVRAPVKRDPLVDGIVEPLCAVEAALRYAQIEDMAPGFYTSYEAIHSLYKSIGGLYSGGGALPNHIRNQIIYQNEVRLVGVASE